MTGQTPKTVACPAPPAGCGAGSGEPCTSHGGTRARADFHQARTVSWQAARIAAVPAAQLVADAVVERRIRHGRHAAELLAEHGHQAEADRVQDAVRRRNGHLSAKQTIDLLIDDTQNGGDT